MGERGKSAWLSVLLLALPAAAEDETSAQLNHYSAVQRRFVDVAGGATKVTTETDGPAPLHGAFPLRVFIDNSSGPTQRIAVTYAMQTGTLVTIRREVDVQAGEHRTVVLSVPASMNYGVVSADGPGLTEHRHAAVSFQYTPNSTRLVLCLGRLEDYSAFVDAAPQPPSNDDEARGPQTEVLVLPPSDAPLEPMAYSGFSAVVVPTSQVLGTLSDAQRATLESYVLTGGTVVLNDTPSHVAAMFPLSAARTHESQPVGFGHVLVSANTAPRFSDMVWATPAVEPQERTGGTWGTLLKVAAPRLRFILIIVAFTAVLGVGAWVVSRRRGPGAVLVWIPSVSGATCAIFVTTSLLLDGFATRAAVYGYTLLDAPRHRAITVGLTAFFANLGPGRTSYSAGTTLHGDQARSRATTFDWTNGLTAGSDFIPSRTYVEWGVTGVEPTRARVSVTQRNGVWLVQNALGGTARQLFVDVDGVRSLAVNVADGAEAVLAPTLEPAPQLASDIAQRFPGVRETFSAPLAPNTFHAVLEGQGFVPTGGLALELDEGLHHVRGEVQR